MQTKTKRPLRVGLFGIGLDAYWPQFKGLKQRLEGYVRVVHGRLKRPGVEVVNLGLIDSPFKALEAGHRFRQDVLINDTFRRTAASFNNFGRLKLNPSKKEYIPVLNQRKDTPAAAK